MNTNKIFVLILSLFLGFVLDSNAQNVPYKHFKILKGDSLDFQLKGNGVSPVSIVTPKYGEIPPGSYVQGTNNTVWDMQYWPYADSNFVGIDHAVLEYRGNPGSSVYDWPIKVIKIDFEIVNSILTARNDFYNINTNSTGDTLDILSNDSTSADSLTLDKVMNIRNGTVNILSDYKVVFTPNVNFSGTAFFNYQISDEKGSIEVGNVIVKVADEFPSPDTLKYYVTNTNFVSIIPNKAGFNLDQNSSPSIGELDFSNDPEIIYTPFVDSTGVDQFKLFNNQDTIVVDITVVEGKEDGNAIVDDKVYTARNTDVTFNVKDNDYKKNYWNLTYTEPSNGTLAYNGQAEFTYTPDNNFYGFDEFTYTVQLSFNVYQTATVQILVDDFKPVSSKPYNLNTSKNSEIVLNYNAPIEGYSFNLVSAPLDGIVNIYPDYDTVHVNCSDISGTNLIVYTPNTDFVGHDRFEIEYCPPNSNCQLIKVELDVLEELSDSVCPCASYNCVWPGDADNNGVVNMKDLLPLAYYIGQTGDARETQTTNWLGLNAPDWDDYQSDNGFNLKHVDANGDGVISELDSLTILSYYNKEHNLYNTVSLNKPEFPVNLIFSQDTFEIGDTVHIFISIGDKDDPAKEINGIFYTLQFDPTTVDSASFHHEFLLDSWLANGSASMEMDKQYLDGQLDAVYSRINPKSVSGIGLIAKCDYIIEDELDGIRPYGEALIPQEIKLANISGMNGEGKIVNSPTIEKTIYIKSRSITSVKTPTGQLLIYPSPANNLLNIASNEKITHYKIFNSLGMLQLSKKAYDNKVNNINISSLINGIYYVEVLTENNQRIIKKIEIIK